MRKIIYFTIESYDTQTQKKEEKNKQTISQPSLLLSFQYTSINFLLIFICLFVLFY